MILRRLSQSLKEQNWTAIIIEFVLLVTGVFLGIQVSNWNAERETRQKSVVSLGFVNYWREKGWPTICRPLGDSDFECGIDAPGASQP